MRHQKIKRLLFHYALNELPSAQKNALDDHIGECVTCKAEIETFHEEIWNLKAHYPFVLDDETMQRADQKMHTAWQAENKPQSPARLKLRFEKCCYAVQTKKSLLLDPIFLRFSFFLLLLLLFIFSPFGSPGYILGILYPGQIY